ncbi:WD repeat-containing protein 74 [Chelonus insularis]|uniref:WD repeat-containing protein 74 n=1 Tax=Chelonus insularis TaxID=460826 RepID=UPI001589B22F|nr:WD repeat-containing protein 74 [Chelonus insularis]
MKEFTKDFDIFVGGKSGVFKGVKFDKKTCITKNIQNLVSITKDDEITTMSWADEDEREILIGCGSNEVRSVKIYDSESGTFTSTFRCDIGTGKINGISRYNDAILTAVESGHVKLWRYGKKDELVIEAGENLHKMKHSSVNKNIIATGGKEHKLQLFDLEKKIRIFEEKNVRNDWLELRVPQWVSDIGFLPHSQKIATCSRYGYIRLYDPALQRRPVINIEIKDQALTTLAIAPKEKHIVVGSGKGIMNLVDLRKPGKILNTYKGFVGGITAIACSKDNPYIVSVGLDRFLRVHDLNTKKLLQKNYLTSRLSCLVLRSDFALSTEKDSVTIKEENEVEVVNGSNGQSIQDIQEDINTDEEYDAMFNEMQAIGYSKSRKKKKNV